MFWVEHVMLRSMLDVYIFKRITGNSESYDHWLSHVEFAIYVQFVPYGKVFKITDV